MGTELIFVRMILVALGEPGIPNTPPLRLYVDCSRARALVGTFSPSSHHHSSSQPSNPTQWRETPHNFCVTQRNEPCQVSSIFLI